MDYEAFAKSIVEAQKNWGISDSSMAMVDMFRNMPMSHEPSYAKVIIEAVRAASSIEETLKLSFRNLELASLADNSPVGKVAMQWAAAPLEELKQTGEAAYADKVEWGALSTIDSSPVISTVRVTSSRRYSPFGGPRRYRS